MKNFLAILFCFSGFFSQILFAETLVVGGNGKFHSIKDALVHAKTGDEILVQSGIYTEGEIIIDKRIVLKGTKDVILDGLHKTSIIIIRSNGVTVQGLTIRNSGYSDLRELAGIRLEDVSRCKIEGNYLYDNYFGIYLSNSQHCKILNTH